MDDNKSIVTADNKSKDSQDLDTFDKLHPEYIGLPYRLYAETRHVEVSIRELMKDELSRNASTAEIIESTKRENLDFRRSLVAGIRSPLKPSNPHEMIRPVVSAIYLLGHNQATIPNYPRFVWSVLIPQITSTVEALGRKEISYDAIVNATANILSTNSIPIDDINFQFYGIYKLVFGSKITPQQLSSLEGSIKFYSDDKKTFDLEHLAMQVNQTYIGPNEWGVPFEAFSDLYNTKNLRDALVDPSPFNFPDLTEGESSEEN